MESVSQQPKQTKTSSDPKKFKALGGVCGAQGTLFAGLTVLNVAEGCAHQSSTVNILEMHPQYVLM